MERTRKQQKRRYEVGLRMLVHAKITVEAESSEAAYDLALAEFMQTHTRPDEEYEYRGARLIKDERI